LRAPIKDALDAALSEADIQRMWRELQSPPRVPRVRARFVVLGATCAIALCALVAWWRWPAQAPHADGPLAIVGANATRSGLGPAQAFGGERPQRLSLDDGSHVDLSSAARLEVLENSSHAFATQLRTGRCEFEVKPGGPRRWSIACGVLTVEVVGTHFAIDRSERGVRVEVTRGVVLVRGEHAGEGARRLTAGQSLFVPRVPPSGSDSDSESRSDSDSDPDSDSDSESESGSAQPARPVHANAPTAVPAGSTPAAGDSAAGESAGMNSAAGSVRAQADAALSAASAELWLRRADDARRRGQRQRAEQLLEGVVLHAQGSPHAAIAALSLARLLMAQEPARAAAALASVAGTRTPEGLREDILARLVEAYARAGQRDLAREAAARYTRVFPNGGRQGEVRHWVGDDMP
jgi:transmembrane sensor